MSDGSSPSRKPEAPVDRQFIDRWSIRAFSTQAVSRQDLATIFEAARWSPSCFNDQPWLFVYGIEAEDHERMAGLLVPGNRLWAERAPVLGIVFARKQFDHNKKPNRWAPFDAGAASLALALQASARGLATHFMGGFDAAQALELLEVPADRYEAMAAFAIGYPGDPADLSPELRERETPTGRKPLAEVAREGRFFEEESDDQLEEE